MHVSALSYKNVSIYRFTLKLIKGRVGPHSTVGKVSGCRYVSDCRSRGRKSNLSQVLYFCGDREIISMGILLPSADSRRVVVSCAPVYIDGSIQCVSDCRSRGSEFDPGLVPYFSGDRS